MDHMQEKGNVDGRWTAGLINYFVSRSESNFTCRLLVRRQVKAPGIHQQEILYQIMNYQLFSRILRIKHELLALPPISTGRIDLTCRGACDKGRLKDWDGKPIDHTLELSKWAIGRIEGGQKIKSSLQDTMYNFLETIDHNWVVLGLSNSGSHRKHDRQPSVTIGKTILVFGACNDNLRWRNDEIAGSSAMKRPLAEVTGQGKRQFIPKLPGSWTWICSMLRSISMEADLTVVLTSFWLRESYCTPENAQGIVLRML
jgi:hypothetical protein